MEKAMNFCCIESMNARIFLRPVYLMLQSQRSADRMALCFPRLKLKENLSCITILETLSCIHNLGHMSRTENLLKQLLFFTWTWRLSRTHCFLRRYETNYWKKNLQSYNMHRNHLWCRKSLIHQLLGLGQWVYN